MSRQSKAAKKKIIAQMFTQLHKNGQRGPTPKGGPFLCAWRPVKRSKGPKVAYGKKKPATTAKHDYSNHPAVKTPAAQISKKPRRGKPVQGAMRG